MIWIFIALCIFSSFSLHLIFDHWFDRTVHICLWYWTFLSSSLFQISQPNSSTATLLMLVSWSSSTKALGARSATTPGRWPKLTSSAGRWATRVQHWLHIQNFWLRWTEIPIQSFMTTFIVGTIAPISPIANMRSTPLNVVVRACSYCVSFRSRQVRKKNAVCKLRVRRVLNHILSYRVSASIALNRQVLDVPFLTTHIVSTNYCVEFVKLNWTISGCNKLKSIVKGIVEMKNILM